MKFLIFLRKGGYKKKSRIIVYYNKKRTKNFLKWLLLTCLVSPVLVYFIFANLFFVVVQKDDTMLPNIALNSNVYFFSLSDRQRESENFEEKFHRGDLLAISSLVEGEGNFFYNVGDFFVFMFSFGFYKLESNHISIRRVIGLPGEYFKIENKQLFINEQPYFPRWEQNKADTRLFIEEVTTRDNMSSLYIPQGYVFVLCDNWDLIADSRQYLLVPFSAIQGIKKYQ